MSDTVNQEERDLLLGASPQKAEVFDMRSSPRHNRQQLRALRLLHDSFCGPLGKALAQACGAPCKASVVSAGYEPVPADGRYVFITASSGGARLAAGLSRPAAWTIFERLLGGTGQPGQQPDRPHTGIENSLLKELALKPVLAAYGELWSRVAPVAPAAEEMAADIKAVQPFAGGAETVAVNYSLDLDGAEGELKLLLPAPFLKPLMPLLDITKLLADGAPRGAQAPAGAMFGIPVGVRVVMARLELKLRELNSLAPGDILRLDTRPEDEVEIEVEGQTRFYGMTGRAGNFLGVQVVRAAEDKANNGEKK